MLGYGQWRLLGHYASYLEITPKPFPDVRTCYLECSLTCSSQPCEKKVSEISLTRLFDLMFWLLWLLSHLFTQSRKTGMYDYLPDAHVDRLAIEACCDMKLSVHNSLCHQLHDEGCVKPVLMNFFYTVSIHFRKTRANTTPKARTCTRTHTHTHTKSFY